MFQFWVVFLELHPCFFYLYLWAPPNYDSIGLGWGTRITFPVFVEFLPTPVFLSVFKYPGSIKSDFLGFGSIPKGSLDLLEIYNNDFSFIVNSTILQFTIIKCIQFYLEILSCQYFYENNREIQVMPSKQVFLQST